MKTLAEYLKKKSLQDIEKEINAGVCSDTKLDKFIKEAEKIYSKKDPYTLNDRSDLIYLVENGLRPNPGEALILYTHVKNGIIDIKKINIEGLNSIEIARELSHDTSSAFLYIKDVETPSHSIILKSANLLGYVCLDGVNYNDGFVHVPHDGFFKKIDDPKNNISVENLLKIHKNTVFNTVQLDIIKDYHFSLIEQIKTSSDETELTLNTLKEEAVQYHMKEALRHLDHEEAYIIPRDYSGVYKRPILVGLGNIASSAINVKEIEKTLKDNNVKEIFMFHNHPTGVTSPSDSDHRTAEQIENIAQIFNKTTKSYVIGNDIQEYTSDEYMYFSKKEVKPLSKELYEKDDMKEKHKLYKHQYKKQQSFDWGY